MTLVSSPSNLSPLLQMEAPMSRASSVRSATSSLSFNLGDIQEELDEIEKVYVAVGKEVKEWSENLTWLLTSIDRNLPIVFLHVHQPAQKIATQLGYMPTKGLEEQELNAFRKLERQKMNEDLKKYVDICTNSGFKATILTIDNDDIADGLLNLIKQHNITNLVTGAGSERNYSIFGNRKDNTPTSKIAKKVKDKAQPSCRIRFISKGKLICVREPSQNEPASNLSRSSSGFSSGHSIEFRSQSMPPYQAEQRVGYSELEKWSRSVNVEAGASFPIGSPHPSNYSGSERYDRSSSGSSRHNLFSETDDMSLVSDSVRETPLNNSSSSFQNVMEDVYTRLMETMDEAGKLKREVYEESTRRNKAELDLVQAHRQNKAMENMLNGEKQKRAEIEEKFVRQSYELAEHNRMYTQTQNELIKANEVISSLKSQNTQLGRTVTELQTKLKETSVFLEKLKTERGIALREAPELNRHGSNPQHSMNCVEFTYLEIKDATNNFDQLKKIGGGGYGAVYKAFLRHTMVAIKVLSRDSVQGDPQFYQEIDTLSRVRHPHLVTLLGACVEARMLVYEYLPLGSLDNHLSYKGRNQPLSWQIRAKVALEICSALIFLHSSLHVHGDLKPENVLLSSSYTTKLSDFGICRQINLTSSTRTPYHLTEQPKGTLPYMDPEYLSSGELTHKYDVFSFGIVLLQLVTGKDAKGLRNTVEIAMERKQIKTIIDPSAGWPLEQAQMIIQIGLRCSDASGRRRPDLVKDVWARLESIENVASASRSLTRPAS